MVYVLSNQDKRVNVMLDGHPVTAAYQLVEFSVMTTHVMPKQGRVTAPMGIQVCVVT